jgi:GT2 family glycosyltransferase
VTKIAAVIVHHRSYGSIVGTVTRLISEGIPARKVVVIDTSEQPALAGHLAACLPNEVAVHFMMNLGYGAAVNEAVRILALTHDVPQFLLVATHEVRPSEGAVTTMLAVAENDTNVAAVGPTLVTGERSGTVWSEGGELTRFLKMPRHVGYMSRSERAKDATPRRREWLDGAFVLYRWEPLEATRFDERFFLYMEEVDLHLRLSEQGYALVWAPEAVVWQSSNGVPPFYFSRNLRLLFRKHQPLWRRLISLPIAIARRATSFLIRGKKIPDLVDLMRGVIAPIPIAEAQVETAEFPRSILLINPLGGTLHHYQAALADVLRAGGTRVYESAALEPSAGGGSRVGWVWAYVRLLMHARQSQATAAGDTRVLSIWPVLGYLDLLVVRLFAGRKAGLILHDPEPLVRAIGYGPISRWLGLRLGGGVTVVVHSEAARAEVVRLSPGLRIMLLPHPVLAPERKAWDDKSDLTVRVLGQYKNDRDLRALEAIASSLPEANLTIHGRGWPEVSGWSVHSRFISEEELSNFIRTSDVVVIPYRRFFQSGIAFRSLEKGVPFVGPAQSSLQDILGSESRLLVDSEKDWAAAVKYALREGRLDVAGAADTWRAHCLSRWRVGVRRL